MTVLNRKDLDRKIDSLDDEERRKYAKKVIKYIESEKRFDKRLSHAYLVLEGSIEHIPTDLEAIIFTERLHQYLTQNGTKIGKIMYSPTFIHHRDQAVYSIAVGFIADIASRILELLDDGQLKPQEERVFRFTADESTAPAVFPYEWQEEEEEEEEEEEKQEKP